MNKIQKIFLLIAIPLAAAALFASTTYAADGLKCGVLPQFICSSADNKDVNASGIWYTLIWAINILSAGVGIIAVGVIVYAGFLYSSAQGNTEQVKQAISMIKNAVIGLIAFAFMFAAANYLIPGGVFGGGTGSGSGGEACSAPGAVCK